MGLIDVLRERGDVTEDDRERINAKLKTFPNAIRPSVGRVLTWLHPALEKPIADAEALRLQTWCHPITRQALEDIHRGTAILFIGAGFSLDTGGAVRSQLSGEHIKQKLLEGLTVSGKIVPQAAQYLCTLSLGSIAELYERTFGPGQLNAVLVKICKETLPRQPLTQHRLLARLQQFRFIVTTNWDRLIEAGFDERVGKGGVSLLRARQSHDLASLDLSRVTLLKIHGDLDLDSERFDIPPRVTDSRFRAFQSEEPLLFNLLEMLFTTHRVIVIGFRPDDYNFQRFFDFMTSTLNDRAKPICFVDPDPTMRLFTDDRTSHHIPSTATDFLSTVRAFCEHEGGRVGKSFKSPDKHVGVVSAWRKDLCDLAAAVRTSFPQLLRVEIVDAPVESDRIAAGKRSVGHRAANVLKELVSEGCAIAFSCGSTLKDLVETIEPHCARFRGVRLYGMSLPAFDDCNVVTPFGLITLLAQRLEGLGVQGRSYHFPSSFAEHLATAQLRHFLTASPSSAAGDLQNEVALYLDEASQADVFFLGVGAMRGKTPGFYTYARGCLNACRTAPSRATESVDERLTRYYEILDDRLGYVGDLMYRPFGRLESQADPEDAIGKLFLNETTLLECLQRQPGTPELFKSDLFKEFLARLFCHVQSINLEKLIEATKDQNRTVAIVASGRHKAVAVRTLCLAGFADTLVIDQELAEGIRDLNEESACVEGHDESRPVSTS